MATVLQFDLDEFTKFVNTLSNKDVINDWAFNKKHGVTYDGSLNSIVALNDDLRKAFGAPKIIIKRDAATNKHTITVEGGIQDKEFDAKVPPRNPD